MSMKVGKRAVVAARIREARQAAGLTQGQMANLLNLHRPSVSEIEAGNRAVSVEELAAISKILDVDIAWLAGEGAETVDSAENKLHLAARELQKLKPSDLEKLLKLLASMRGGKK
jgi:transcriptional regulator with XRE-family HTH domain